MYGALCAGRSPWSCEVIYMKLPAGLTVLLKQLTMKLANAQLLSHKPQLSRGILQNGTTIFTLHQGSPRPGTPEAPGQICGTIFNRQGAEESGTPSVQCFQAALQNEFGWPLATLHNEKFYLFPGIFCKICSPSWPLYPLVPNGIYHSIKYPISMEQSPISNDMLNSWGYSCSREHQEFCY